MKNYNNDQRNSKIIQLDHLTNNGKNHRSFKKDFIDINTINLSLDDTIYRIFKYERFAETLKNQKLTLVRPHKWDDPFENFLLTSVGQLEDGRQISFEPTRNSFYGQCWTLIKECDGLWRNYKGESTVAIKAKTTVERLMNQFYDFSNKFHQLSYFIGKVDYVDDKVIENFFKNEINILNFNGGVEFVQTLLIKRLPFSYEEEVRIVFNKPSTDEIDLRDVQNPWDDSDSFNVTIDPNLLFNEVEVDPWITKQEYENLKKEIRNLGYKGNITRSSLYDRPFFISNIR